jgi:ERCC4-type nuclease
MPVRRRLIPSPLDYPTSPAPVPPPPLPAVPQRGGSELRTPKPVLIIDTREQNPFNFYRFRGWFSGMEERALKVGDYSISGMEDVCTVERKDLPDLISSFTSNRRVFVDRLKRMRDFEHRLLVVTAPLAQIKSRYSHCSVNPNKITQSLIAVVAGLGIPFVTADTHELGAEIVASYLYQVHLYQWLDANDHGRYIADNDL